MECLVWPGTPQRKVYSHALWGQLSTTYIKSTEVANGESQLGTPSCSRPQSATDNGVRDGRSN